MWVNLVVAKIPDKRTWVGRSERLRTGYASSRCVKQRQGRTFNTMSTCSPDTSRTSPLVTCSLSSKAEITPIFRRLTRSPALSPAFKGGGRKRRSGSAQSKPRHVCRGAGGLTHHISHMSWFARMGIGFSSSHNRKVR